MTENRRLVFISCGQYTEEERELGKRVCALIDEVTPFKGYFAENQTTLEALSENVLRRLYNSVGLVVIMHNRGTVDASAGRNHVRASVWIEQEIAIATLMQQILMRPLHVALFIRAGIAVEGIRQQLQLNGIEFTSSDEVIDRLREIVRTWTTPLYRDDQEIRKLVESACLLVTVRSGHILSITIYVDNRSDIDIEIKNITLWSEETRLCGPVSLPGGLRWSVPGRRNFPIEFPTEEDVPLKMQRIHGSPTGSIYPGTSNAKIRVDLVCEILGIEKTFRETSTVHLEFRNHLITGL